MKLMKVVTMTVTTVIMGDGLRVMMVMDDT